MVHLLAKIPSPVCMAPLVGVQRLVKPHKLLLVHVGGDGIKDSVGHAGEERMNGDRVQSCHIATFLH